MEHRGWVCFMTYTEYVELIGELVWPTDRIAREQFSEEMSQVAP